MSVSDSGFHTTPLAYLLALACLEERERPGVWSHTNCFAFRVRGRH